MAEIELVVRDYARQLDELCPAISVAELQEHLERTTIGEQGGGDLLIDYLPQPDEGTTRSNRRGRSSVVAAVAATILVVVGLVVVADGNSGDEDVGDVAIDPTSGFDEVESFSSRGWSRVPDDETFFGGSGPDLPRSMMRDVTIAGAGPGLVAVGGTGGFSVVVDSDSDATVWTSPDGIDWSRVPHDEAMFGGGVMKAVAATEDSLVAVGAAATTSEVATLSDLPHIDPWIRSVVAARPADSDAAVWTSTDGATWSRVPHDEDVFGGAHMQDITAGGPGLVAVGAADSDAAVWTSTDGTTWSRVPHDDAIFGGAGQQSMASVTVGGPGLVAVGVDGEFVDGGFDDRRSNAAVWTSTDGISWSRVPHDEAIFGSPGVQGINVMSSVTAGGPGLVAVGGFASGRADGVGNSRAGAVVWTSVDGIMWSRVADEERIFVGRSAFDVTATGPFLVAAGWKWFGVGFGTAVLWTSTDGINWSPVTHDDPEEMRGWIMSVTAIGPRLVAVGSGVWVY